MCTVERLSEILQSNFSTLPVVNMSGSIIGMVPKKFVYILIKHQSWYERATTARKGVSISKSFATVRARAKEKKQAVKPINVSQESEQFLIPKPVRDSEIEVENVDADDAAADNDVFRARSPSLTGSINADD